MFVDRTPVRHVIVRVDALNDLCELTERAIKQLDSVQPNDPLQAALRGALAEVRAHSILDPCAA